MGNRYVGVLALYGESVALVRESYPTWGGSYWNVPSGAVEVDESPEHGAVRELREETGIHAAIEDLELVSTVITNSARGSTLAWNYVVRVADSSLQSDDPDELIEEVRWFPVPAAIAALARLPYEPLRAPAIAYLHGDRRVTTWSFSV